MSDSASEPTALERLRAQGRLREPVRERTTLPEPAEPGEGVDLSGELQRQRDAERY
ncbi:hypothetical protein [Agrococcus sp. KRD186]|jgi:hypothetical protein|uniref:hypothetical protein n=1 Tax=Agrococcus sp. KRD186 TaxID=2729730 RepID=UPI0019D2E6C1|nr:hypothetical protein [Agrococcus sp. KRD186]